MHAAGPSASVINAFLPSAFYPSNQVLLTLALFQHVAAQCSGKSTGLAQHDCFAYQAL
jgi:hypothetical protein